MNTEASTNIAVPRRPGGPTVAAAARQASNQIITDIGKEARQIFKEAERHRQKTIAEMSNAEIIGRILNLMHKCGKICAHALGGKATEKARRLYVEVERYHGELNLRLNGFNGTATAIQDLLECLSEARFHYGRACGKEIRHQNEGVKERYAKIVATLREELRGLLTEGPSE